MKLIALFSFLITTSAFSHSGGTDSSGCHYNHKTGDYHCHGGYKTEEKKGRGPASVTEKKKSKKVARKNERPFQKKEIQQ